MTSYDRHIEAASIVADANLRLAAVLPGYELRIVRSRGPVNAPTPDAAEALTHMMVALRLDAGAIYRRSRRAELVERRGIIAVILREPPYNCTLKKIGFLLGGRDHTSIISIIRRVNGLLSVKDESTLDLYNTAAATLNEWQATTPSA